MAGYRRIGRASRALVLAIAASLAGCASTDGPSPVLIPNRELNVSRSLSIPADVLVLAAAALIVIDPLAPNIAKLPSFAPISLKLTTQRSSGPFGSSSERFSIM